MSKSSNIRRTFGLLFVVAICVVFVCADLFVSSASIGAQNANMTGEITTRGAKITTSTKTGSTQTTGKRRRRRRRARAAAAAATEATASAGVTVGTGVASMESSDMSGTQLDLSGTYNGTVVYPEGGITGPATLTVTGNNFSLAPDAGGAAIPGRVTAVVTRGYVGVTMMFGDTTPPPVTMSPPPLPAVSLRARMSRGHVTLTSVPGEKREFSFTSALAMKMNTHRKRRMHKKRRAAASTGDQTRGVDMTIKPPTAKPTP